MFPRKVFQCSKGKSDSRIEVSTGDVSSSKDDDHNDEASGGSTAYDSLRAVCLLVNNGGGSGCKHKNEGPDEFSTDLFYQRDKRR